ncbi:MAG: hypothetical protein R2795_26265 [Saprospiraceae bacterium]
MPLANLTQEQQAAMYDIEERRERNLAEIASLEQSDYRQFLMKRKNIRVQTEGSIRRFLTPEQRKIQDEAKVAERIAMSDLIKQYQQEGKSKEEIEMLLLERG